MSHTVKIFGTKFEENKENAGYDLKATVKTVVPARSRVLVKTGVKTSFSNDVQVEIRPRSGLALKEGITVLNTPGTIDSGYRGEYGVILFNTTDKDYEVNVGDKIAQAVFMPVIHPIFVYVDSPEKLDDSQRKDGAFGSTGR